MHSMNPSKDQTDTDDWFLTAEVGIGEEVCEQLHHFALTSKKI